MSFLFKIPNSTLKYVEMIHSPHPVMQGTLSPLFAGGEISVFGFERLVLGPSHLADYLGTNYQPFEALVHILV